MGLFDKFRKNVEKVVEDIDEEKFSAPEDSQEALEAIAFSQTNELPPLQSSDLEETHQPTSGEDDLVSDEKTDKNSKNSSEHVEEDDWDDWDDNVDVSPLPVMISKKDRKRIEKEQKKKQKKIKLEQKKGRREIARPKGSKVNLQMMRSTTGRQLVAVKQAPKGSLGAEEIIDNEGRAVKIDLGGGVVESGGRVIKESQALNDMLEELEWVLLESDISSPATTAVMNALRVQLIGSRLRRGAKLGKVIEASLKRSLHNLLSADYWDFNATVNDMISKEDTPVIVMMVGVNGTGKTTTTAKIAHRLKQQGHSVVAAAADTFRAGAIEQLSSHCERIGIRCISGQRGGDSAAIARDTVESARAKGTDVVLIDTAGRMQNKSNLMNELLKVHRVTKPHLVLFVGDALAGNDAVDQAVQFQNILSFDGAVLTKLDTDAKGGAALSIAHATEKPIVLAGGGQEYDDLKQFDPDWLLDQLFE